MRLTDHSFIKCLKIAFDSVSTILEGREFHLVTGRTRNELLKFKLFAGVGRIENLCLRVLPIDYDKSNRSLLETFNLLCMIKWNIDR